MSKYDKGKIVTGRVTGIEKYGVFVSLDEFYSGLIHISEISDGFVKDIHDFVSVGETIKARIVDKDDETYHIKLSIKNINYRIENKKEQKLKEVASGFKPLEEKLDGWIMLKLSEKNTKNNKWLKKIKKNK